ncbi:hypothetical protein AVEN_218483-1 [Araneus ventricosus]|uniref:Uncharacterized protein n=1 Tax=Araneus ventricosus TaxID=182803 RepID=A0A4Y2RLT8_ARAVE|nr:hypothetical protein AVEN_218483-1 [Araneus ventricosus]
MSAGPGTDIIALLYSLYLVNKPLVNGASFKVISRHGSWRNLVTEMMSSSIISVPDESTCKLIECDFLKELSKKAQGYLKAADVLLMCNSFSSSVTPEKVISNTLQRVIHLLKPGALVFFIDSKEKSTYFKEMDSFGTFLYGPVEAVLENMPYNEKIAELVGVKPLCSGRSLFAVWQKLDKINFQMETLNSLIVGSTAKLSSNKSDARDINSLIPSMSNLKREFSSDTNINSSESIASSSQFSSSSISSQIIERRDNSVSLSVQNMDFSSINCNASAKKTLPASVNASDSLVGNKFALPCENGQKNKGNDMKFLLKNLENLISKFEGIISSQDSLQNSHVKEKQSSSGQHCHLCMHQSHCRCSVKPCHFNGNGLACCCHSLMCYNNASVGNHKCVASNLYRILPEEGPCIVIPLQNLSNESLTHILTAVSQNCSVNKTTSTVLSKEDKS